VASHIPFVYTEDWTFTVEGQSQDTMQTLNLDTRTVSPGYFGTMAIEFTRGDNFTPEDKTGNPGVVIINETMARRFWSNGDPIGKRIKLGRVDSKDPWLTIRGVVKDSAQNRLDDPINPEVYFPLAQMAWRYRRLNLAVKTSGDPMSLLESIRNEIKTIDKDQPVYQIQTIESLISQSIATRRFAMVLLLLFAVVALLLAAVGIYGVMAYTVTQRTHEIGIRLALGAQPRDVLILMVKQGMVVIVIGLALGIAGAVASTRLMSSMLYGVSATDPVTFVAVAFLLAIIALFSCYIPARRATKVDPMVALRYE
jgi:predicted permease